MIVFKSIVAISLGASFGALFRYAFEKLLNPICSLLNIGTLSANIVGGFLIGLLFQYFSKHPEIPIEWRLFSITGFLGALTTFSAFSLETSLLLQHAQIEKALLVIGLHVLLSIAFTFLGFIAYLAFQ